MQPKKDPDDLDDFLSEEEEARLTALLAQGKAKESGSPSARSAAATGGQQGAQRSPSESAAAGPLPPPGAPAGSGRYLKVLTGANQGTQFALPAHGPFRVGRAPDVEVQLEDNRVSRYHCRLNVTAERVTVLDLGSKTGTLVNNHRIEGERRLLTGDVLVVGDTHLQLTTDLLNDTTDNLPAFKEPPRSASAPARAAHPATGAQAMQARPDSPAHALAKLTSTSLGYFVLGPLLGVGKSGAVFRALDTRDQGPVAVKVFLPEFSNSEEDVQRFVRAAKTVMPLRNLHLVDCYNAGRMKGHCWLSMELIEGPSIAWHVQQAAASPAPWRLGLRVLREVTRALIFLHGKQIIHRNLTPENLLCSADGLIKVGDLITAKAQEGKLSQDVTAQGHLVGDLRYLAPERTFGDPSAGDARSDLYSLGAVVYAVLTGRPPLEGKTTVDTIEKIRERVPSPLSQLLPGVPPALDALVIRLLAKEPELRFDNATDLLRHLVANKLME
jgi:pSer/pThr/pTyr-binding forkhead associated (FHA) protein